MTVATNNMSANREDPQYTEGLAHLQAGEWQEAIRCFEALLRRSPDNRPAQQGLSEARFKASIDAQTRVRARRWIVPWRAVFFRSFVVILVVLTVVGSFRLISSRFAPALAQTQTLRQQGQLLAEGKAYLEAGNLDAAEARFTKLLAQAPDYEEAKVGLAQVKAARELDSLYSRAAGLQESGQLDLALGLFTDLLVKSPAYRDVSIRVSTIKSQQDVDQLLAAAEADYRAGRDGDAAAKYEQVAALNQSYQRVLITGRLFELYVRLGSRLIERESTAPDDVLLAEEYFSKALAIQPRNTQAALEQRLAGLYLAAQADYRASRWDRAAAEFELIYAQRPGYLGGKVIAPLYEAYIRNGDNSRGAQDCAYAYEQYRKAASLPIADRTLAVSRLEEARPCLTPTPTPSNTPTPTLIPTATAYVPPTLVPTATPPPPLATFRNQIVFKSAHEQKPGFWVMNPDGSNARYLGDLGSRTLQKQYDELVEKQKLAPDGRYRVYVTTDDGDESPQLYIQALERDQYGNAQTWRVTGLTGLNYDPVWAPDGSRIAFVSTHQGTDDVWVIDPDGKNAWNYTRNEWEWDKHPSWSPDSWKIVFWSNREGTKQIFVIDANGQNLKKIHAVAWDEYDPIWVK